MVKSHVLLKEVLKDRITAENQLSKDKRKSLRTKLERSTLHLEKAIQASIAPTPKTKKRGQFHSLGLLAEALSEVSTDTHQMASVARLGRKEKTTIRNEDALRFQRIAQSQSYIANPLQAMSQHLTYAYAQKPTAKD